MPDAVVVEGLAVQVFVRADSAAAVSVAAASAGRQLAVEAFALLELAADDGLVPVW
jgi:hypothetical protein